MNYFEAKKIFNPKKLCEYFRPVIGALKCGWNILKSPPLPILTDVNFRCSLKYDLNMWDCFCYTGKKVYFINLSLNFYKIGPYFVEYKDPYMHKHTHTRKYIFIQCTPVDTFWCSLSAGSNRSSLSSNLCSFHSCKHIYCKTVFTHVAIQPDSSQQT